MHNFEHNEIAKNIVALDKTPEETEAFAEWIEAKAHLEFLRRNALSDQVAIYVSGEYSFVHSLVVENDTLDPVQKDDLLGWSGNPFNSIASYTAGGGRDDVWIERGLSRTGADTLEGAMQLIFGRDFEGATGSDLSYFELHQEYSHLAGIHWRPERSAYCKYNSDGDMESVVTITNRNSARSDLSLVTFKWETLEQYLVASRSSLVRMFDFTLFRHSNFIGWPSGPEEIAEESDEFFYRRKVVPGNSAYTRGVQIIRPRKANEEVYESIIAGWFGGKEEQYAEYIIFDWRHKRLAKVSALPGCTTNYFEAQHNDLPFELSPAFFKPEVLLKYKGDRDKYTVGERDVSCRTAWHLEAIDVNAAGQVHAYVCYLRRLPYSEQLHWASYNEKPKTGISERAVINDFEGQFVNFSQPLRKLKNILQRWRDGSVFFWTLRDERQPDRVSTPLTDSRDEWSEAFLDLAKLVVEGFNTKPIRAYLDSKRLEYRPEERTIALLEKLPLQTADGEPVTRLVGLRTVQNLRSKLKGHAGGSDAEQLAHEALSKHESFTNHFNYVCDRVVEELNSVDASLREADT